MADAVAVVGLTLLAAFALMDNLCQRHPEEKIPVVLDPGEEVLVSGVAERPGGKGCHVAVGH